MEHLLEGGKKKALSGPALFKTSFSPQHICQVSSQSFVTGLSGRKRGFHPAPYPSSEPYNAYNQGCQGGNGHGRSLGTSPLSNRSHGAGSRDSTLQFPQTSCITRIALLAGPAKSQSLSSGMLVPSEPGTLAGMQLLHSDSSLSQAM